MTLLRQRMIEDRQRRGLSERTQEMSVRAVRHLADHDQTAPEQITEEERRDDFLSLTHVKHASRSASTIALYGITCFYEHPLKRDWTTLTFVRPPQEHTRPVILSLEDVHTLLQGVRLPRYRACLTTIDACGLRLQEGTHLQMPAMARARLLVPVRCGTGATDRSVPLPHQTLALLRQYWQTPRHPVGLFPAPGRSGLGMATASTPMPRHSVQEALRAALQASGIHQRASVHTLRHAWATHLLAAAVPLRLIQQPERRGHALAGTATRPALACPVFSRHLDAARSTAARGPLAPVPHLHPPLADLLSCLESPRPGSALPRRPDRSGRGPAHLAPGTGLSSVYPCSRAGWRPGPRRLAVALPPSAEWLVPVHALSHLFRGTCTAALTTTGLRTPVSPQVWHQGWVPHGQPAGTEGLASFAPSLHRLAITTNRLETCEDGHVTCRVKERTRRAWSHRTLPAAECMRRFLQHVLPKGCITVRSYGRLSPSRRPALAPSRALLTACLSPTQAAQRGDNREQYATPPPPTAALHCPTGGGHLVFLCRLVPQNSRPPACRRAVTDRMRGRPLGEGARPGVYDPTGTA